MKKSTLFLVLFLIIATFAIVAIRAADDDEIITDENTEQPMHESDQIQIDPTASETMTGYISSPDVEGASVLLNGDKDSIKIGQDNEILLGFTNSADRQFTVKYIRGYVTHSMDFSYVLQNFTGYLYNSTVFPEETNSFVYKFSPNKVLESGQFGVVVDVYYINDDNDTFATTFFNETCTMIEASEAFNVQAIFSYISVVGMIGFIGYIFLYLMTANKKTKRAKRSNNNNNGNLPEESAEVNVENLPAHIKKFQKKKKSE